MAQIRIGTFETKSPAEAKDYSLTWDEELDETGDTISSSTWVVTGTGLTQALSPAPTFDDKTTTVWYEAGTALTDYVIVNRIVTTQGRTHEASAVLPCRSAGV